MKFRCEGCGTGLIPGPDRPFPFRCTSRTLADDVDHLLAPEPPKSPYGINDSSNPFLRYGDVMAPYRVAQSMGLSPEAYRGIVERLDDAVTRVDGHGFRSTPMSRHDGLSERLGFTESGGIWLKDETGQVGGSHKARHLMGIALYLEVARTLGWFQETPRLAIASCGNAALAAAVMAAALEYPLDVFIPEQANETVVRRLVELGAQVQVCERREGERGDPCYLRFMEAVDEGAVPFCCQGPACGLTVDGGRTLGYEILDDAPGLDHLVIQVGGGAFGSSIVRALEDHLSWGHGRGLPRFSTVQTTGASPLHRAWTRMSTDVYESPELGLALARGLSERSRYMWAWEDEPVSIATGILDDETYDWHRLVMGMIGTGGYAVVADEDTLAEAHGLVGGLTALTPCVTGTSGLAGAICLLRAGRIEPTDRVGVVISGVAR